MARDDSPMKSVDKALLALETLSKAPDGLPLGSLASKLGLRNNSLHRTLSALRFRGYVIQNPETGNYELGPSLLRLSDAYSSDSRLRVAFHPLLQDLSAEVNELCHLGILEGTDIVCVDRVEPALAVRVWTTLGQRSAAATSGLGRAIIAFQNIDFETFASKFCNPIPQRTPYTQTDPHDVWDELQAAKRRGYAMERQQSQEGVSCVAFPVLRKGSPILSISVTAPDDRMGSTRIAEIVVKVRELVIPRLPAGLSLPEPSSSAAPAAAKAKPRGKAGSRARA